MDEKVKKILSFIVEKVLFNLFLGVLPFLVLLFVIWFFYSIYLLDWVNPFYVYQILPGKIRAFLTSACLFGGLWVIWKLNFNVEKPEAIPLYARLGYSSEEDFFQAMGKLKEKETQNQQTIQNLSEQLTQAKQKKE